MAPAVLSTILNYRGQGQAQHHDAPAVHGGGRAAARRVHRAAREGAGLGVHPDLRPHGDGADPHRLHPDYQNTDGQDDFTRRARAGVEAIGVDIQVLDDDGKPVPQDNTTIGEVCARSNVVLKGYWLQPEETDEGDLRRLLPQRRPGVWDEFGNIHIVDRKKDVIISGGENISSPEIEDALYQHPAVLECAVIGVPSEKWGETPKALIVLRAGHDGDRARDHRVQPRTPRALQAALPPSTSWRLCRAPPPASSRSSSSASATGRAPSGASTNAAQISEEAGRPAP